ncbi:hypothetical protein [Pseudoclavibacter sp. VKM Ac-2867]|uniref:hypothetical protein n=1 Tax=Pseudoclavibacter sp. VKM Ac-2867 TaxID=2783829 RepID=UPI00188D9D23|nr:hypothetical protein [Pseudoclavibacter sp. VKM Ac-2867]MBF4459408.1 hypothetical protein [Pseudoclavibacter sp. VKM Ac-2867]
MYDLTEVTGKKRNRGRRMIFMTVETDRRTTYLVLAVLGATLPFALPAIAFLGIVGLGWVGLVIPVLAIAITLILIGTRSTKRQALRVSRLRALDASIGAKRGRTLTDLLLMRASEGAARRTNRILVNGEELVRPEIIDFVPSVIGVERPGLRKPRPVDLMPGEALEVDEALPRRAPRGRKAPTDPIAPRRSATAVLDD